MSAKMRASSARINSDKACARLNERNALNSQLKVATSSVSNATTRAILNVRNTPENETQNEASSKNRIMVKKDGNLKARKKGSVLNSPKCSKRTNRVSDKHSLDIKSINTDRENDKEIESVISNDILTVNKKETDSNLLEESESVGKLDESNDTVDISEAFESINGDMHNKNTSTGIYNIANTAENASCDLETVCAYTSEGNDETSVDHDTSRCTKNASDHSIIIHVNKVPRPVQIQQRFPLRSKLKKPTSKTNHISDMKIHSNIPKTKYVTQINANLSESLTGKISTAKTPAARGGKQCQSKLPSSQSKLPAPSSKTEESNTIEVKLDKTVSIQSDSSTTLRPDYPEGSDTIYSEEHSENIVPKAESVIHKTCIITQVRQCSKNSDFRKTPDECVNGYLSESNTDAKTISAGHSVLSNPSSSASSLAIRATDDDSAANSDNTKCLKQAGANAKQDVVKRKISSQESKLRTHFGKTPTTQTQLRATIKHSTSSKSDRIGVMNSNNTTLKSRQRSVTHDEKSDDNQERNKKSISLVSQSNGKSRLFAEGKYNQCSEKQIEVKFMSGDSNKNENRSFTKAAAISRPTSDRKAKSQTLTQARFPKPKLVNGKKVEPVSKLTDLNRSCSSTSSRDSNSSSKSRSNSRSRSSTPSSIVGTTKHVVDTGNRKRSLEWKSKSSSRDSSSRSRSSTPSVTSSVSDDNKQEGKTNKRVKQNAVAKRPVSKLKIPLRSSVPMCSIKDKNNSDINVKSKFKCEVQRNVNTENGAPKSLQSPTSAKKIIKSSENKPSVMTRNSTISKCSKTRNSNSRSRSTTPEEVAAHASIALKKRSCVVISQIPNIQSNSKINARPGKIAEAFSAVATSQNGQLKNVGENKSRESTSRSRSTTPGSATSSDGAKSSSSSITNKTRRITNNNIHTDKTCISRQNENIKQQGSIPNKRMIKATSGIPARTNKHSPDIKDNKARKLATYQDGVSNSSERNETRTTTLTNSASTRTKSKLPLTASTSQNTSRSIPKLQKRPQIQKSQNVQSQITHRLSPTDRDKPTAKSTDLSMQPSSSIKLAKITISTENKRSKNEPTTLKTRTTARPEDLKSDQKRNKAFVSGNKSGLITSLSLIKKDNVSSCLDNKSDKQSSLVKRGRKSEIEHTNLSRGSAAINCDGTDSVLNHTEHSIHGENQQGIVSCSEQTVSKGNKTNEYSDTEMQNTCTDIQVDCACVETEIMDKKDSENRNKNESKIKYQHDANLIRRENSDATDKQMESVEIHHRNSSKSKSAVISDPSFEVNINCLSRNQLNRYSSEHEETWLELNREESTGLKKDGIVDEKLRDLCQESMSKFHSEIESLCAKNNAFYRNIKDNSITKLKSSAEMFNSENKYSTEDVCVEIISDKNQSSKIDNQDGKTVILVRNNSLNSNDEHGTEVNNYAVDLIDKPLLSSGNATSVPSHACKCQDDKKSEISTFEIDMYDINSSQKMPIIDVCSLKPTESSDFSYDKASNIVAATPSGAFGIQHTNKRQDKKITSDSTCVLCNDSSPCIHMDVNQQNIASVCVTVCQTCEPKVVSEIASDSVNEFNQEQLEYLDKISENITMDESHLMKITDGNTVPSSELGNITECNGAVINLGLIKEDISLSDLSNLKTDEQRCDVVADNSGVLDINDDDAIDEQQLVHDDFNTKMLPKRENYSQSCVTKITSNIEDWQETFLCDKKSPENNTDVELQVPNNSEINKATSCNKSECTSLCLCSNEDKTHDLSANMDKTRVDIIACDFTSDDMDKVFVTGSGYTKESKDMCASGISAVQYMGVSEGLEHANSVSYSDSQIVEIALKNDPDLVTVSPVLDTTANRKKNEKTEDIIHLTECDSLEQQDANHYNDEWTSRSYCSHEEDVKLISGGYDGSFQGSLSSVYFMQNTGKSGQTCERNICDSNESSNDLLSAKCANESESRAENLDDNSCLSDIAMPVGDNVNQPGIIEQKVTEQTLEQHISYNSQNAALMDSGLQQVFGICNDDDKGVQAKLVCDIIDEIATANTETISLGSIHEISTITTSLNPEIMCEQHERDHTTLEISKSVQISRDNDIISENLTNNEVHDTNGIMPSYLLPQTESAQFQPDVSLTNSNNIDETTAVCEIREKHPKCFDNTNDSDDIFSQQVINNGICEIECATGIENKTTDTWAEFECSEHDNILTPMLPGEINKNYLSSIKDSKYSENLLEPTHDDSQRDITNESCVYQPIETTASSSDMSEQKAVCSDSCHQRNTSLEFQIVSDGSPEFQTGSQISSEMQIVNERNIEFQRVSDSHSDSQAVSERMSNFETLPCSENISDNLPHEFGKTFYSSAAIEQIRQCSILSGQSILSDSDSRNVRDLNISASQTEDLDLTNGLSTNGQSVIGDDLSSSSSREHQNDADDREFQNNANVLLHQNLIDLNTSQIVDHSNISETSDLNSCAPYSTQNKLFNEQFDDSTSAFDGNTCAEINYSLNNASLFAVKTPKDTESSKQEFSEQNKNSECYDLNLVDGLHDNTSNELSIVDQTSIDPNLSNVELNALSEDNQSTNIELSKEIDINESELNINQVCATTEDGLSDICDTFVDAEDSDKNEHEPELNDIDSKENRLSLISVNTSTDSFVDAVESLDDEYLTSSVLRHSREIQNEDFLSQNPSDTYDVSSDISDSIDDMSGWEEFTENIEDIGDINSSEMELDPHKMTSTGNKFSKRPSELQHCNSVSRIRSVLQDKYYQINTPTKRETITSSVNETKKISYGDKRYETDRADISGSIFKTGNVCVSGEVKSQSVRVEAKHDSCTKYTDDDDNGFDRCSDSQCRHSQIPGDAASTGQQLLHLKGPSCHSTNGHLQNSDSSVGSRIETALMKRTERRRRRHVDQQYKSANLGNSNDVNSDINATEIIVHTSLNSKDNVEDSICIENVTCTHSTNSATSLGVSDNMTFNNKTVSGNESLSSQNNTGIELNIMHINTNLNTDKHEQDSGHNAILREACNVQSSGVDNNESSILFTITAETVDKTNVAECPVEQSSRESPNSVIQTWCTPSENMDIQRVELNIYSKSEVTDENKLVPDTLNGTPELDDIEFIDADDDSETSSKQSSEVSSVVNNDLLSNQPLIPTVCVTISLDNNVGDPEIGDGNHSEDDEDVEVDNTMISLDKKEADGELKVEEKHDKPSNETSIFVDDSSDKDDINIAYPNECDKLHANNYNTSNEAYEHSNISSSIESSAEVPMLEQSCINAHMIHATMYENNGAIVLESTNDDSSSTLPDSNDTNTEIVEESNISVKHALELERLKLADSNDVRSRKALFDSKRSGRRATIETSSIELKVESSTSDNEEQKTKVAKPVKKSKSFRYEKKVMSPISRDDKTAEAERAVSPVSQKVSDICKSFMTKTRSSVQRTRDESTSKSPAPQRKLMKWVNDHGKWLRIPVDDITDSQRYEVFSPDNDDVENKFDLDVDSKHETQLTKPVEDTLKRNDTLLVKSQPPPVPQKSVGNRSSSHSKELLNPLARMESQLESSSKLSMPFKETSSIPVTEQSYKDKNSKFADTKRESDDVLSVPISPSIIIQPNYSVTNLKCAVNDKTNNGITAKTISQEVDEYKRAKQNVVHTNSGKEITAIEAVDVKVNDDDSQTKSECFKAKESEEKCSHEVKVIGTTLEDAACDQDTHMKRQELLFGLLDSYNRRKPRKISHDEIGRRCASPIGMRTGYVVNKDQEEKVIKADEEPATEKAICIPKIKAIKIQEEVFECKSEYIKDNNLKLNYEIRSDIGAQKAKLLRKSKTFSGMADFERKYEPQTYDSFRQHESNLSREHLASSVDMINKQIDRHNSYSNAATVTSKMMDKRARAGLKLQIDKAKYRSRNTDGENSPNCLNTNQTNSRSQGDRSPNRLAVNQPMVRMRSPDKGPRIQRSKLLSEIVEVEENKDDISVTCDRQQQQRHLKDRNKVEVQRAVKGSNKRRSLSLPTGTLAFGEARVVFKNGHFTIETMDGMQIDSSRPALYQTNVRMSESHLDDNWGMPDTGRDEFSNSSVKSNSREITVSDHNKRPMRRQHGKAVLQSYDSSEDVFYSESEILESVQGYKGGLEGESCAFGMGRTSDDVFNESSSSRASDMSVDSYYSDRTDISLNSDIASDSKKLSSSSLPEQKDEDVKRVMQRAKRTSSFRAAQEAGASRLSGIHEDKVHETGRSRSVSVDESQSPDLNILPKTQTSQSQNPTFLKKVMAKRKSLNENLNISAFAKQSETAKEFFSKKMTLKGLFRKNKSDSSVGSSSPLRMDHPSSPPLATFQDDDIASVDTPPSSPYHGNREFRGRRHTSADIYRKSFQPDSSETDSNCPTPTLERSGLSHLSVSSPSTPSHKSGSFTNLTSQTSSHDDVISIASVSSISSSSVHSPPSEQPNKPKTPKPVGASPRRNPSFGSQLSRTGSMSSQRNVMNSVTSLDGENYEPFTDDAIRDPRCECGNKDVCLKHRSSNSATSRGSSDSLNTLCRFCKQMDYYYKNDNLEQKQLQSKEKLAEDLTAGFKKDSPARTNLERLGIIVQQADVASSNSNDSGIQRDASVHSSNESIKGVPDGHVRLRRNKSLSPHQDRPKSEIAVRWADGNSGDYDLVESPIKLRHREQTTRDRPRPKSDLEGSSFLSDRMKAFGSEINLQPYCSLRNLYDTRRRDVDKQKNRRMSTPHPIKTRLQTTRPQKLQKQPPLVRSSSMPESLEKIHKRRKMHHLLDFHLDSLSRHMDLDDCMSDGSDLSFDQASLQERSVSIQSSNSQLTSMDEDEDNLTYAEALWDHITLDPEEIGFCAQDVIHVLDMDDKDWWYGVIEDREGWFPANFVRLRVNQDEIDDDDLDLDVTIQNTLTSSPKLRRISMLNKNQARSNVVNEIINAEREYVKHLKDVVEGYIQHARKRTEMFPEERIRLIFGNIETIYSFAQKFLSQLEMCIDVCPHLSEIGQCFLDNDHGFEIYSDYCNNHPSACEELDDVCKNSKYKHFFEACRLLQELVEIPLEGFLLTPVQKICKYPLQLAELLKYTPPDHADYVRVRDALAAMRKIATLINERKRKMESIEKIAVWQHSVVDWEGPELLDRSSELIFSGELNKINSAGWSQERFFFLFDHQLVYCKKELLKRHVFNYKGRIDLDNCEIIDIPDGKDTQYNVTVKHGWKLHELHKDKWYLVYAKTEAVKQHWLKSIKNERKRVLEDQENDFCVPDHWKQTVLNKVRSQSNLKDKQSAGRFSQGQLMLQRDCKDFTYSTLPRLRASQKHDTKKKGWFKFGTGKKSKR